MHEVWCPIVNYENSYEVSTYGRVRSTRFKNGSWPGRPLKQQLKINGYLQVCLCNNSHQRHVSVHRLVAETFLPTPLKNRVVVNHIDGNKTNNHASNLEWVTCKENSQHDIRVLGHARDGENSPLAKLTNHEVVNIRKLYASGNLSYRKLSSQFNISKPTIKDIIKRRTWRHI